MGGPPIRAAGPALLLVLATLAACAAPVAPASAPVPAGADARACQDAMGGAPWHGLLEVDGDRVALDAFDDYFSPGCLVVPAGRAVTLVLTDRGHLPHTLTSSELHVDTSVDAGQTAFVPLPPVRRPTRMMCGLHEEEHMVLAVVPASQGPGDV